MHTNSFNKPSGTEKTGCLINNLKMDQPTVHCLPALIASGNPVSTKWALQWLLFWVQQTYMRCAGTQAVVDCLQLGVVEQGLQVSPGELLRRCSQLLQVNISSEGDAAAQSLQDLHTSLLEMWRSTVGFDIKELSWVFITEHCFCFFRDFCKYNI